MYTHLDVIKPLNIKSTDTPAGRFYVTPTGKKYPSITTLLGHGEKPWLKDWRKSLGEEKANKETKRAADRGTAVHAMVEKHLNNEELAAYGHKVEHIAEFNSLRLFLKKINNIYCQEIPLYSDELRIAGRVDCIAEYNGNLSLIDFKTTTTDKKQSMIGDYYLQTTAYALMFQEMYGIHIDDIVIVMSTERGVVPLVFKEKVDNFITPLILRINTYYNAVNKGTK